MNTNHKMSAKLQALLDDALLRNHNKESISDQSQHFTGIQLYMELPSMGLKWSGASGHLSADSDERIAALNPVAIASNTKTFVAAAVLRLWEQQQLLLDNSIGHYISAKHKAYIQDAGYQVEEISIRHLLSHTSGLFDYADSAPFQKALITSPQRRWTRTEQLQLALDAGSPYGLPGQVYRYSDTGYILLGEMIEQVYGKPLAQSLSELLDYQKLGLSATWLETCEQPPQGLLPRVVQYIGDRRSDAIHPSCDLFGGGGLVSTVEDLGLFIAALFRGHVYKNAATLQQMLTTVNAEKGGPVAYESTLQIPNTYRLGIDGGIDGSLFSHAGYLGTYAGYIPNGDIVFCFSMNQHYVGADQKRLVRNILNLVNRSVLQ